MKTNKLISLLPKPSRLLETAPAEVLDRKVCLEDKTSTLVKVMWSFHLWDRDWFSATTIFWPTDHTRLVSSALQMILSCTCCSETSSWEFLGLKMRLGMFSSSFLKKGRLPIWRCSKTMKKSKKSSGSVKKMRSSLMQQKTKNRLFLSLGVHPRVR